MNENRKTETIQFPFCSHLFPSWKLFFRNGTNHSTNITVPNYTTTNYTPSNYTISYSQPFVSYLETVLSKRDKPLNKPHSTKLHNIKLHTFKLHNFLFAAICFLPGNCPFEMGQTTQQTLQYQTTQHQTTHLQTAQFPICSHLFPSWKLSIRNGTNHT